MLNKNSPSYLEIKGAAITLANDKREITYVVRGPDKALCVTSYKPGTIEWRRAKFEWIETIRPTPMKYNHAPKES
jgi:hypothetical protein